MSSNAEWIDRVMAIEGFTNPEELAWLYSRASQLKTVVEIGTWKGRSAAALALSGATVWTVDHFRGSPSELDGAHAEATSTSIQNVAQDGLAPYGVHVLALSSLSASRLFPPASVDMVFIDGEHTREAVLVDLLAWAPKARRLLCGHDADWQGVMEALAVYGLPFELGPGSIWYVEMMAG